VRLNQNRFVTLHDADTILQAVAQAYPALDSVEGRNAFHGDANHTGRYTNPNFPGYFFYRVTAYDAAYILMYLAAKLPFLPWDSATHPVPMWKEVSGNNTSISGITADVHAVRINGSTALIPIVLHGSVNGPLGVEMNVASLNTTAMQFIGAEPDAKVMMHGNASGKVVLAGSGEFKDGDVLGYLEFNVANKIPADFEMSNLMINDVAYGSSRSTLAVFGSGTAQSNAFAVEQNMPNPFVLSNSALTTIRFNLTEAQNVNVHVFDMLGKEVRSLVSDRAFPAGSNSINWDGRDNAGTVVPAGAYYYQVSAGEKTQTVKMQVAH